MKVLILLAVVAYAAASDSHSYRGQYNGKCDNDGLYYRDAKSFVFCSNGNSYVQPCAPGTRNSAHGKFSHGGHYTYNDFCDVNLVDHGYAAHHGHHGHNDHHGDSYGHDAHHGHHGHNDHHGDSYGHDAHHGQGYGHDAHHDQGYGHDAHHGHGHGHRYGYGPRY